MKDNAVLETAGLQVRVEDPRTGRLAITSTPWTGFGMSGLVPALLVDGRSLIPTACHNEGKAATACCSLQYVFGETALLDILIAPVADVGIRLETTLRNTSSKDVVLNHFKYLHSGDESGVKFGADPNQMVVFEQGNYWGRVVPLISAKTESVNAAEPGSNTANTSHTSDLVSLVYDRQVRMAFLAGFETSERWLGRISIQAKGETAFEWDLGADGGDLLIPSGETVALETVILMAGSDPWALLERYGDVVKERHNPKMPERPPVSWCSWYPYRLAVNEEAVLENARVAAKRLKPLGLKVMELDLGWEKGQLPSAFEENDQFPHGLKWLSEQLDALGFHLGVWKAPYTISEFDPLAQEHPEWLVCGEDGKPVSYCTWFWAPHGNCYILDLTHPGAQAWLKEKVESLRARGVKYLKSDFIGCVSYDAARRRHDPRVVAGNGTESGRIGARIIREALPDALLLNCGGPEMPGTGHWPLLYTCSDTGNTGFIDSAFQRENYQNVACHLFKNFRWGILQPSCLCVGLPGTVEDARLRATVAFMAGGQIDISDTIISLPEDRWEILTSSLPVLDNTARPADLFEPVYGQEEYDYSGTCSSGPAAEAKMKAHSPGSVWTLHVKTDWDEWDLVAVFCHDVVTPDGKPRMSHYVLPRDLLGLASFDDLCGYEFWSRQFLGAPPKRRVNPHGYAHPGDFQDLVIGGDPDKLEIGFFGPGVKLLCFRRRREHPWIIGTSSHQSCGAELGNVEWDPGKKTLLGTVERPEGEMGTVIFSDAGLTVISAEVAGRDVKVHPASQGAFALPVYCASKKTEWKITFAQ